MTDVDQAVVDEILAKAEEDTEEGRLEKLEKEVEALKGSIKRLLLDIRETMNKLENPFVNLQSLAESNIVPQSAPQIQIVPTKLPEEKLEDVKEEKEREEEEGKEKVSEVRKEPREEEMKTLPEFPKAPAEEVVKKVEAPRSQFARVEKPTQGKIDFMTLYRLMEWVNGMISKHSYEAFKLALEVFETTGYITAENRDLLMKLAEISKLNGAKDLLIELYKLNKALKPEDKSLDSDLLALLLETR
ncbi:MAG: hypothetical protein QXO16_06515 [Archaeoglobaceae archaeon]